MCTVEFVQPLSLFFFLFLTTSLRSTEDGILNLLDIKPEVVHLTEMHSTCYRMTGGTGRFRLHLIPSFQPINLSERGKKTKIKTWRINSNFQIYTEKSRVLLAQIALLMPMNLEDKMCHCSQEVWVRVDHSA